jgi:hypothetical protein
VSSTYQQRPRPNLVVRIIRWTWFSFVALFVLTVLIGLGMMLFVDGSLWPLLLVALIGVPLAILVRNRRRSGYY